MSQELPEVQCKSCDAVFTVIYNRGIETEGGIEFCPFCGIEGRENFEFEDFE